MSTPKSTLWSLDDHTQAKHEILRRYLQAWLPIMMTTNERVVIVDGFAGPGEYENGEIGSPLIIIETFIKHGYTAIHQKKALFLFIENERKRFEHLSKLLDERKQTTLFPAKSSFHVFQGTFKDTIHQVLKSVEDEHLTMVPTFVFIDPFGYSHTPLDIIKGLMSRPKCEVLITFMYEEINRFLTADYRTKKQQYDELFGTDEWQNIVQKATNPAERMRLLHDLYRNQLISTAGVKYVRSFCMRNKRNATDYFLFFGTRHLSGLKKMKEAMCKVDPTGTYQFSDFTNPNQLLLLSEPNYAQLRQMLISRFKGKIVSVGDIEEFVIAETAFCKYKESLKEMEKCSEIVVSAVSSGRRKGTFADSDMYIQFL